MSLESGCLGMQPKVGGKLHLRLNIGTSLIENKYSEGKLKRTLKREFSSTSNRLEASGWDHKVDPQNSTGCSVVGLGALI